MIIFGRNFSKTTLKRLAVVGMIPVLIAMVGCGGTAPQRGWSGGSPSGNTLYVGEWSVPLETGTTSSGLGCSRAAIIAYLYGSPAVSDNAVFIGGYESATGSGKIYSVIPGEKQPDRTLDKVRVGDRDVNIGPIVGSLVIENGQIYFGSSDGRVYALNDRLQPIWSQPFTTKGKIWSTPAVSNGTVYIGSLDKKLYALDATTGTSKWEFTAKGGFVATPTVDGDTVYAGSFDRNLYAIDANTGTLRWSFEGRHGFWAEPIVRNGLIYAPCLDGKVYVLKTGDGSKVAEIDLKAPISSSPVLIGDTLIVATEQSKGNAAAKAGAAIWTIDTTNNQGQELTRIEGEKVFAPLVSENMNVFIHTDHDSLYGIDITSNAKTKFTTK
jgi:outer membrane protein assembly factor BamB